MRASCVIESFRPPETAKKGNTVNSTLVHHQHGDLQARPHRRRLAGRRTVATGSISTDEIVFSIAYFLRANPSELGKVYREYRQFRRRLLARLERASRRNCEAFKR